MVFTVKVLCCSLMCHDFVCTTSLTRIDLEHYWTLFLFDIGSALYFSAFWKLWIWYETHLHLSLYFRQCQLDKKNNNQRAISSRILETSTLTFSVISETLGNIGTYLKQYNSFVLYINIKISYLLYFHLRPIHTKDVINGFPYSVVLVT